MGPPVSVYCSDQRRMNQPVRPPKALPSFPSQPARASFNAYVEGEGMRTRRLTAGAAVTAAAALVLAACNGGTGDDPDTETDDNGEESAGEVQDTAVTVGWNQSFYEYNSDS